jgi:hypothetical protein
MICDDRGNETGYLMGTTILMQQDKTGLKISDVKIVALADKRTFTLIPKPGNLYAQRDQQHTDSFGIQLEVDSKEAE